jgi:uncharacterized protein
MNGQVAPTTRPSMRVPFRSSAFRRAALALALLAAPGANAATPSFVCSKAKSWVEKTICASDRLSELDLELASVYARLLRTTSGDAERTLTAGQRRWWAAREECRKDAAPATCLETRYAARIDALRSRPDYTEARPGPVALPPQAISAAGEGWSRGLSGYLKAIRACLRKAPSGVTSVGNAWPDPDNDDAVLLRMRSGTGETFLCGAQRNGSEVLSLRAVNAHEDLPAEGPLFYPDPGTPPGGACGKPVQVLDEYEAPAGWVGPACGPLAPASLPEG